MEFNWRMIRWACVFGGGMGLMQIINVLSAYEAPPSAWTVIRFAVLPAIGTFVATVLQSCPKPPQQIRKNDSIGKPITMGIIALFLFFSIMGCSTVTKTAITIDQDVYDNNVKWANQKMKTWSYWSGCLEAGGFRDPNLTFPITLKNAAQTRMVLRQQMISVDIAEMDRIVRAEKKWSDDDFNKGLFICTGSSAMLKEALNVLEVVAPQLASKIAW